MGHPKSRREAGLVLEARLGRCQHPGNTGSERRLGGGRGQGGVGDHGDLGVSPSRTEQRVLGLGAGGGGVGGQVGVEQWEPFPRVPSPRAIHILAPGVCGTLAARASRRRPSRRRPGLDGPPGAAAKSTSDNLI